MLGWGFNKPRDEEKAFSYGFYFDAEAGDKIKYRG